MSNPYSPPKAVVDDIQVERSRIGIMYSSAVTSILSVTGIIVVGMLTAKVPLNYKMLAGIALVVIPISIVTAVAIAAYRRINVYIAAITSSLLTLILTLAISYGFGSSIGAGS